MIRIWRAAFPHELTVHDALPATGRDRQVQCTPHPRRTGAGEFVHSEAKTIQQYLANLPDDRRKAIKTVRALIRKHLPRGHEEALNWGMITCQVPLKPYPDTYNGQPQEER